ncbi:helix-turn-helix domain-containing protein [Pseudomonas asiatica]|uniref:helix-turn-helix domain-containing protein n=1 Tax=Pseudomonas asiatica TaxID=2219225 RepID=UPI0010BFCF16|nr:helix-turn-helix domain-containing protein [Pseudomonas asiatica]EKT4529636.1 helix-turn-helix domain-containing protein [Pseudomonas putida]
MTHPGHSDSLPGARIEAYFEKSGTLRKYERGTAMLRYESPEPKIFLLQSGTAALHVADPSQSNDLNVIHLVPGDVFGTTESEANNRIQMYVLAKTECVAYVMTASEFLAGCSSDPTGMFAICNELTQTSLRALRKVGQFAFFDVRGRVSSALVELCTLPEAKSHPKGFLLNTTRVEIASMVGCTREMVGKVLQNLQDEGLISLKGRQTLVHAGASQ